MAKTKSSELAPRPEDMTRAQMLARIKELEKEGEDNIVDLKHLQTHSAAVEDELKQAKEKAKTDADNLAIVERYADDLLAWVRLALSVVDADRVVPIERIEELAKLPGDIGLFVCDARARGRRVSEILAQVLCVKPPYEGIVISIFSKQEGGVVVLKK